MELVSDIKVTIGRSVYSLGPYVGFYFFAVNHIPLENEGYESGLVSNHIDTFPEEVHCMTSRTSRYSRKKR